MVKLFINYININEMPLLKITENLDDVLRTFYPAHL